MDSATVKVEDEYVLLLVEKEERLAGEATLPPPPPTEPAAPDKEPLQQKIYVKIYSKYQTQIEQRYTNNKRTKYNKYAYI